MWKGRFLANGDINPVRSKQLVRKTVSYDCAAGTRPPVRRNSSKSSLRSYLNQGHRSVLRYIELETVGYFFFLIVYEGKA